MRVGADALIAIRTLQPDDREPILRLLHDTGVFTDEEVAVALELLDIYLERTDQQDYDIRTAVDERNNVAGYYCIGPAPMTTGTFDLYWIAVAPAQHQRGVGKQLLHHAEENARARGGRLLIAETSSKPSYTRTREFYIRNQYIEVARIKEYYRTDDDLVIYGKYLSPSGRS